MPDPVPNFRPGGRGKRRAADGRPSAHRRGYDRAWRALRRAILLRDRFTCQLCGRPVRDNAPIDHIVSKRNGGGDAPSNLRVLCVSCHNRRTARAAKCAGQ